LPNLRSKERVGQAADRGGSESQGGQPRPGTPTQEAKFPRVSRDRETRPAQSASNTWKPRGETESPRGPNADRAASSSTADGCSTDPEAGMDSRRATVRNMRSKCRCSCVLQFTFRRAVSCVLHRPPSQVIHCTVLFLFKFVSRKESAEMKEGTNGHQ
jgi:hypothetical protein